MARPLSKSGVNSTTERELVWWVAKGFGFEDAAKRAGLPSSAKLYRLKRTNAYADDLRQALKDHLATELAPKAIRILDEIMCDAKMPARVRVDAAKTLLDRSGFTPAAIDSEAQPVGQDMGSWTSEELRAFVDQGMRDLARDSATEVEFEASGPSSSATMLDDVLAEPDED